MGLRPTTPSFFYKRSVVSVLLYPAGFVFALVGAIIYFCSKRKKTLKKPKSICIGNFIAGGSGKTPVCIAVAKHLIAAGHKCCFLTIGFGRKDKHKHFIKQGNPAGLMADVVGDEPLLLAEVCDVFVVNKRRDVLGLIEDYDFVISDDGLWDKDIEHDVRIAILSKQYGFGNGLPLPAGPLRSFAFVAKFCSDWVLVLQDKLSDKMPNYEDVMACDYLADRKVKSYLSHFAAKNRLMFGKIRMTSALEKDKKYLAFAGLGNNEKFFNMIKDAGYNVALTTEFPDHYAYSKADFEGLRLAAEQGGLVLVTTAKDYIKIKEFAKDFTIEVVTIDVEIEGLNRVING